MKSNGIRGLWIPIEILLDENLSKSEMCLLSDIAYFDAYYKNRKSIAALLKVNETTASTLLSNLEKKGYIVQVGKFLNKKIYAASSDVKAIFKSNPDFKEHEVKDAEILSEIGFKGIENEQADRIIDEVHNILGGERKLMHSKERRAKVKKRLKNFSEEDLLTAADNLSKSKFHMGQNDNFMKYASVDFLMRSDEQVEKWLNADIEKNEKDNLAVGLWIT